eukprot:Hpha_TRINITY_DN16824_c0_g1::TRINITY_DN16824_c0_g1_i2::g.150102::m.150102
MRDPHSTLPLTSPQPTVKGEAGWQFAPLSADGEAGGKRGGKKGERGANKGTGKKRGDIFIGDQPCMGSGLGGVAETESVPQLSLVSFWTSASQSGWAAKSVSR